MEGVKWKYKGFELDSTDSGVAIEDFTQRHDTVRAQLATYRTEWKGGATEREEKELNWLMIVYI